jgi:septum site-determining protein MinD
MQGKITTFWSVRGGSGSTLLSVYYALELSKHFPDEVILVDLSEALPHIHHLFDLSLQQDTTKLRGMLEKESFSASVMDNHLYKRRGLNIMLPCADIYEFTKFNTEHYSALLKILAGRFRYVIADTNAGIYFSSTYASLKNADTINIIIRSDRHSLMSAKTVLEFITSSWQIPPDRLRAVVNCTVEGSPDAELVSRVLGIPSEEIPYNSQLKAEFDACRLPSCPEEISKLVYSDTGRSVSDSKRKPIVKLNQRGGGDRNWVLSTRTK